MKIVFEDIKAAFGSLWQCIPHGNTIEVVTPYSTVNNMFVSIFITQRGGEYIVTDGGWIGNNIYESVTDSEYVAYQRLFGFYMQQYAIKALSQQTQTFYYKKTSNRLFVPNLVYDLANFISAIVSSSFIQFSDIKENKATKRFSTAVSNYITTIVPKGVKFNTPISQEYASIKFGAIIATQPDRMILLAYITGSTPNYLMGSIAKANANFEIISDSPWSGKVARMIPVIDNVATGYQPNVVSHYVRNLERKTGHEVSLWSEKEKLKTILA